MVNRTAVRQTARHAQIAVRRRRCAPILAFGLAAALTGTATANAWLSVEPFTPRQVSSDVQGKVDVRGNCSGYVSCRFHTSVERSSWRGWQTVDRSILSQRHGLQYPTGRKLSGWYDYKSHFHADITQWGLCQSPRGSYACVRNGSQTRDSAKIRLRG